MKHDLEYLADLIDKLKETQTFLRMLYAEKASKCVFQDYDDSAFETFCNHPQVIRGVVPWTDCRHCDYYRVHVKV